MAGVAFQNFRVSTYDIPNNITTFQVDVVSGVLSIIGRSVYVNVREYGIGPGPPTYLLAVTNTVVVPSPPSTMTFTLDRVLDISPLHYRIVDSTLNTIFNSYDRVDVPFSFFNPRITNYVPNRSISFTASTIQGSAFSVGDLVQVEATPVGGALPLNLTNQNFIAAGDMTWTAPINVAAEFWDFSIINLSRNRMPNRFRNMQVVVCLLGGTLIRTPTGDVPVESLKAGDSVLSSGLIKYRTGVRSYGSLIERPIKKMKSLKVPYESLSDISRPVKIKAGALGEKVPEQDLYVSPWHGMVVEGSVRNAMSLINGDTIEYDDSIKSIEYYHIELEQHSIILANGAETETYVDYNK